MAAAPAARLVFLGTIFILSASAVGRGGSNIGSSPGQTEFSGARALDEDTSRSYTQRGSVKDESAVLESEEERFEDKSMASISSIFYNAYSFVKGFFIAGEEHEMQATTRPDTKLNREGESEPGNTANWTPEPMICKTCGNTGSSDQPIPEDKIKAIRLKQALQTLQEKLRLPTDGVDLDQIVLSDDQEDSARTELPEPLDQILGGDEGQSEEEDFYAWDKRKIFTGSETTRGCVGMRGTRCYNFRFNTNGTASLKIVSAQLWVHSNGTRGHHSVSVHELERQGTDSASSPLRRVSRVLHKDAAISNQDWLQLDVTAAVQGWMGQARHETHLAVRCRTCENSRVSLGHVRHSEMDKHKPLLVLELTREVRKRSKRSAWHLTSNYACRVRPLRISPGQLLNLNVISRISIDLNYCAGNCDVASSTVTNHSAWRQAVHYRGLPGLSRSVQDLLQPCCAPIQFAGAMVDNCLVYNFNNTSPACHQSFVPSIRVTACGCV